MKKLPVSVNLVVRNEMWRMLRLLPALDKWFDEIVIADQESTDLTLNIISGYTDKIIKDKATGYAESSREAVRDLSTHDWVFTIDADEIPSRRFLKDIPSILKMDVDAALFHYAGIIDCDLDTPYGRIMGYGQNEPIPPHVGVPNVCRLIKKENLVIINKLHGGNHMIHKTRCIYLKYNGMFHIKTHDESVLDNHRYDTVRKGTYDKST